MDKVAAVYDLIAGLLVAIDVVAPSRGQTAGKWLIERLPRLDDTVNPLKVRTFLVNLFLTILTLVILTSFAISKDMRAGTPFPWSTVGLFVIGVVISVIFISVLSLIILGLRGIWNRRHGTTTYVLNKPIFSSPTTAQDATLLGMLWLSFLILGVLALLLLRFATGTRTFLAPPILTFVLTCWVLPTAMLGNRLFVKYVASNPEKPYYALARIGLLIFIISKFIYIIL